MVPKVRINNIPALVQIMAWRRPGDRPLSEPMTVKLLTHIYVTGLNQLKNVLVQIMAWRRPGDRPLSEPMTVNLLTHIYVTRPQSVKKTVIKPSKPGISKQRQCHNLIIASADDVKSLMIVGRGKEQVHSCSINHKVNTSAYCINPPQGRG